MAYTCAIKNCSNSAYWLNKWKKQLCVKCGCLHKDELCDCEPPFRLFPFPTKRYEVDRREKWKKLVGRQDGKKMWSPPKDSRVCSEHFIDGKPTGRNSLPTLKLGYQGVEGRLKRINLFPDTESSCHKKKKMFIFPTPETDDVHQDDMLFIATDPEMEVLTREIPKIPWIITFFSLFMSMILILKEYKKKLNSATEENIRLRAENAKLKRKFYSDTMLKSDDDVNFYTGLPSKSIFDKLHGFIAPYVNRRWTGVVSRPKNIRRFKKNPLRFGPERKVTSKGEFLMTLMRLKLGLLGKDLAKRFGISETLCSRIFFTWLRACSSVLKSMVYIHDTETLIASKPDRFRSLPDLHSIIDCTEVFIETPKDLYLQSGTWSDYKHHNTIKILIACSPNSSIMYVSPAYMGRISDKALTLDCGYLDKVPMYSLIMADKGFNIMNDCNSRNISLYVPPGRRGQSQMPSASVLKTKKIANHRILIEQVIRRLKTFRILANELPLSLISHVDEITSVCSALCNLKDPIYKT